MEKYQCIFYFKLFISGKLETNINPISNNKYVLIYSFGYGCLDLNDCIMFVKYVPDFTYLFAPPKMSFSGAPDSVQNAFNTLPYNFLESVRYTAQKYYSFAKTWAPLLLSKDLVLPTI